MIGLANEQIIPGILAATHFDDVSHNIYEFDKIHNQAQNRNDSGGYRAISRSSYKVQDREQSNLSINNSYNADTAGKKTLSITSDSGPIKAEKTQEQGLSNDGNSGRLQITRWKEFV
ncbi:hypothetical protein JTB14_008010 [Gonioctena quinquepunctata]|nr:hypothetical protein JTB14_008010 [Gonioctena quinquepunctata]